MGTISRMPRYDVRNDGAGPYAVFYCDACEREFRSQPDFVDTATKDLGKQALGGLLRKVPLVGSAAAENVLGEDPRYSMKLSPSSSKKPGVRCRSTSASAPPAGGWYASPILTPRAAFARMTARVPARSPRRAAPRLALPLRALPMPSG